MLTCGPTCVLRSSDSISLTVFWRYLANRAVKPQGLSLTLNGKSVDKIFLYKHVHLCAVSINPFYLWVSVQRRIETLFTHRFLSAVSTMSTMDAVSQIRSFPSPHYEFALLIGSIHSQGTVMYMASNSPPPLPMNLTPAFLMSWQLHAGYVTSPFPQFSQFSLNEHNYT